MANLDLDTDALAGAGARLRAAASATAHAPHGGAPGGTHGGAAGDAPLDSAVDAFWGAWTPAQQALVAELEALAGALHHAATTFEGAERVTVEQLATLLEGGAP